MTCWPAPGSRSGSPATWPPSPTANEAERGPSALTPTQPSGAGLGGEPEHGQGWDADSGRGRAAVPLLIDGLDGAEVADAAAAVAGGVGVEDLDPAAAVRQADLVVLVRAAGEVGHAHQRDRALGAGHRHLSHLRFGSR